jgi:hypothetical protein
MLCRPAFFKQTQYYGGNHFVEKNISMAIECRTFYVAPLQKTGATL